MYVRAGQEAGPSKTLNQMETVEIGLGPGAEEDVGALSWDEKKKGKGRGNPLPRNNKCFNCGTEGHGIKDVTIEEPPIPFSPFSSADCTMLSHFSFNDFIAIAFPDIAGDLDVQI